jgi:hypothetical protein
MRSLRQWVQRGGALWVMLDRVDPEAIAPLLGEALDFQVVDRTSLTSFAVERTVPGWQGVSRGGKAPGEATNLPPPERPYRPAAFDRPVDFVRVLLPADEQAKYTIDGWPVWFLRHVGRGRIVFTTLGPRGLHRPRAVRDPRSPSRGGRDPRSPYQLYPNLPMPTPAMAMVADILQPIRQDGFRIDSLRQSLADEVGYATVGRGTAVGVFAAFLLCTLGLAIVLRRWGRPELLGWAGPAAALAATVAFVALGEASRRAVPVTIAAAQIVEGDSVTQDVSVRGLMAVYRPKSGDFPLTAEQGGIVDLDRAGVVGQTTRWLTTGLGSWHLENLDLPAGVRTAHFRQSVSTNQPIAAVGHFGPEGLEGKLAVGPLRGLSDVLIDAPGDRYLAVRLLGDGSFRAGSMDILPQGEFLAGTLLSDAQQRRQEIYREYLKRPPSGRLEERTLLLAWADPLDMGIHLASPARTAGSALVILPLRLERSAPGARMTIPGPFVEHRRVWDRGGSGSTRESDNAADMHLRFQLPAVVLPFKVERARLTVRIDAPSRPVTIGGWEGTRAGTGQPRTIHRIESPLDVIRLDITEAPLLQLDGHGGLHLSFNVGELLMGKSGGIGENKKWTIHYLNLEITGRAE